ncbi:hypothetical protein M2125_001017 [Polynucleobacter sphagniphilus]|uniref:hypothetical protein n=1 Tax=Polynucleobacter sphagniphilus TaxID=1743169 RepID=UPI0024766F36|nr:hypothetical protein [Polynucleobacter sphagniphilus]MDH6241210.1 hypothetical protein [Polynucleobacter sphagniphilus]
MRALKFSAIAAGCLALGGCKLDIGSAIDQVRESVISFTSTQSSSNKLSSEDSADLTTTQPLGVIQAQAWSSFIEYSTGLTSISQLPQKIESANLYGDPLVFVRQKLTIEPLKNGKPNPTFFYGADRSPALDWQKTVTADLKASRADLSEWISKGSHGALPSSVELFKARYNAVLTILFTFQAGGNYISQSDLSQKNELWHGVLSVESANRTMTRVVSGLGIGNKNFLQIREQLISRLLGISLAEFQDQAEWLDHFYAGIDKASAVILNSDKGLQIGSDVYLSEAGKLESWKKIFGGKDFYSSNVIAGKDYVVTVKSSKSASSDISNDLKISSDLKESVGTKITQGVNVTTPSASE